MGSAVLRCFRKHHKCASLSLILSYRLYPIRPCGAPFPRGEGYDTRISSSKKAAKLLPRETIRSPSTVIPSAAEGSLLHCRHRHTCALTQTTPWCFLFCLSLTQGLPVCKKDPSTSALMTRTKDGLSHIVFHTAAWIHPAPLARPFSKGLLVSYITPLVPKHATYLPDESPSALAYRHPERRKTPYVRKPQPEQMGTEPKDLMPRM